jgi:hypothetical protein
MRAQGRPSRGAPRYPQLVNNITTTPTVEPAVPEQQASSPALTTGGQSITSTKESNTDVTKPPAPVGGVEESRKEGENRTDVKEHNCSTCGKKYKRPQDLKTHLTKSGHVQSGEPRPSGSRPSQETPAPSSPKSRERTPPAIGLSPSGAQGVQESTVNQTHMCGTCGKQFKRPQDLKGHATRLGHELSCTPSSGGLGPSGLGPSVETEAPRSPVRDDLTPSATEAAAQGTRSVSTEQDPASIIANLPECCGKIYASTGTKGLQLHRRRVHKEEYHASCVVSKGILKKARWDPEELQLMAQAEASMSGKSSGYINQELEKLLGFSRSKEAIKCQRKQPAYQTLLRTFNINPSVVHSLSTTNTQLDSIQEDGQEQDEVARPVSPALPGYASLFPEPSPEIYERCIPSIVEHVCITESEVWKIWQERRDNGTITKESKALIDLEFQRFCGRWLPATARRTTPPSPKTRRAGPTSNRKRRRQLYAKIQQLYGKNRKACADSILSDQWRSEPPPIDTKRQEEFWSGVFSQTSKLDDRVPEPLGPTLHELIEPITEDEVLITLKKTKIGAAGPDNVSVAQIKAVPIPVLRAHFNLWLLAGSQPSTFRKGVTVLIPKSENATDPADFRPITMGSVVARVFHRLLAIRMESCLPISDRQKAFRRGDGLAHNAWLLQSVIKDHTRDRRQLNITFIDVRKAFDSVSQESIILAALRMGVPKRLLDYLKDLYEDNTTQLRFGTTLSETIECRQGVRQGDPLSPILFNCIMDWALSQLDAEIGAKLGWTKITYLAFADDVVVFSSSDTGMRQQLDTLQSAFDKMGLAINEAKSASLRIQVDGKAKKWYVNPHSYLAIKEKSIPAMSIVDAYKYLGTGVTAEGPRTNMKATLVQGLVRLTQAPLKPQQRLSLLRDFLIPSTYHQLIFAGASGQYCKQLDIEIRKKVRQWLGLPHDTPYAFFGCDVTEGGLGIPTLQTQIPRMRRDRVESLLKSNDAAVQAMYWDSPSFQALRERSLKPIVIRGQPRNTKKEISRALIHDLHTSVDGRGLTQHKEVNVHNWVRSGTKLLSGRGFRHAIQVRAGTLPSALRSCRGHSVDPTRAGAPQERAPSGPSTARAPRTRAPNGPSPWCEVCNRICSVGHILQACDRTHDARVKRHDAIVDRIATVCERNKYTVLKERALSTPDGSRRPDLIIHDGSRALVIDVTIVADNAILSHAHALKKEYYDNDGIRRAVSAITSIPINNIDVSSATFNWRGAISKESSEALKSVRVGIHEQEILSVKVVEGGYTVYSIFNRSTWRGRSRQ